MDNWKRALLEKAIRDSFQEQVADQSISFDGEVVTFSVERMADAVEAALDEIERVETGAFS